MWASAIISLLVAIFRAVPSFERLVKTAIEEANKANVAEAARRKQDKDNAVDSAIDGDSGSDGNS